jgi:colanic acid/amylovoran biosynthesis glycosyltransferase
MMRIGLVLPATPGYSETFFQNKIKGLIQCGHEVNLFVNKKTASETILCQVFYAPKLSGNVVNKALGAFMALLKLIVFSPGTLIRFHNLEKDNGASFKMFLKRAIINSHILGKKLDWLHFAFATMGVNRELAGKAIRAKVAVSLRGYDVSIYPLRHPDCYKKLWKNVDKVHTISNDLLVQAYLLGLPKDVETVKITPAIDGDHFGNTREGFSGNNIIRLLTVGRLHWIKGLEFSLEAIEKLKQKGYAIHYTLVGTGTEYERLIYATHQLGLENQVTFAGKVSPSRVAELMANNDIYIQYSIQEGFCNAVLEAQAAGMLCIVSDAEGLSENVLHEETGWVVRKKQPAVLAEQIHYVHALSSEKKEAIKSKAMQRVRKDFSLDKQRKEFNNFYTS